MPELPEVETVRRGLAAKLTQAKIAKVQVFNDRAIREHVLGKRDFTAQLRGKTLQHFSRRGKFLWAPLTGPKEQDLALVMHLGMSGQALVRPVGSDIGKHVRVKFEFVDSDWELHFTDQRTFGGMLLDELINVDGERLPQRVMHIARDALDPKFDLAATVQAIAGRSTGIKNLLLNQSVVAGIGNIYADEALWLAQIHYATAGNRLSRPKIELLLQSAQTVMRSALEVGGTSFDEQYVDADGNAGWFSIQLNAYGQTGEPCARCGRPIVREAWANRSSHRCPRCQPKPRA